MAKKKAQNAAADAAETPASSGATARPRLRLDYVEAGSLALNPNNWRRHPDAQLKTLAAVLADSEVGWAGALLFNERTGRLIDGRGRLKTVAPSDPVPVLIGSWSEEAEKKILLTLDPLAGMATADGDKLAELLGTVDLNGPEFAELAADLQRTVAALAKETPGPPVLGEGGGRESLSRLKFGGYEIALTADELEALNARMESHLAEHGTTYGFAAAILGLETPPAAGGETV